MNIYSDDSLSALFQAAKISSRKRAHLNLHKGFDDKVQRLFIALTKGSYVEPHYHELVHQWEMFIVINGLIRVCHYGLDGSIASEFLVGDGQHTKVIEFLPNDIHSVECISDTALMFELKEGPFDPEFAKVLV
ncbi:WbuC family cupin fold metalloprotein [Vibrio vulnificus]|uniref:WbuC family cupin fold metalloprotein n=1 Tax=Vibrio vulnificus TaxID=672 RepID=UPI00102A1A42|nr:WbuC family cupin fold metalloprotein [Vibrio vulnificus]MCA4001949.1 WbuC family cupin fold metalloprotein [Vibrio vulnificus]MCA4010848.1 WbuC family cupin fold metalloprotein [Vibrio vulnificus]MDK2606649.1 WbuC family cupin fold metalloprotein [Vibrio vulnificus]MDK2612737.1 WbuC family cupin fold metalloprotein [Vibrio vulnificus]MDK2629602.1 WbuC family cupin fold metalloprotein [Vibrio vulnificus]